MSSVLARYEVSGERRKPKPSGRTSSTPSPKICSPCLARRFLMANMSSCSRRRLAWSMSRLDAISSNCETCSALSSLRCMRKKKEGESGRMGGRPGKGPTRVPRNGRNDLDGFVQETGQLRFRQRAYLSGDRLAVLEEHQ